MYIPSIQSIQSSADGHLGCFHLWPLWITLQCSLMNKCLLEPLLSILGVHTSGGIAGAYDNSMFSFLRDHRTIFHSSCIILLSNRKHTRVPIFPHSCQYLFFFFLNYSHPRGVTCYRIMVLIFLLLV